MALGKKLMAGWWCMLCKASRAQFLDKDIEWWTMEDLVNCRMNAESNNSEPKLGVKQQMWWPFNPLTHYVSPLLHCEIGIGNVMFELLWEIVNDHIEKYLPGKESI
jgi:hypothetical protein